MKFAPALVFSLMACGIENNVKGPQADPIGSQPPEVENPIQEDRIVQATEPVVDVLFIVDNSSSMGDEQLNLQNNFPGFMTYFVNSGLDYHIGVVATDMQSTEFSGKLRIGNGYNYIDPETENPGQVFALMTGTLGVIVGSNESGRAAAYTAIELLQDDPRNAGFYREEAELHMIFVTDADDYSGNNPISKGEFLSWAGNLKATTSLISMHSIVGLIADPACSGGYRPGFDYLDYADVSNGVTYSICEEDWAPALTALGLQTSGLKTEFFLTRIPVIEPELLLEVQLRYTDAGNDIVRGFELCMAGEEVENSLCQVVYNPGRNSVAFLDYTPEPFSEVLLTYYIAENYAAGPIEESLAGE